MFNPIKEPNFFFGLDTATVPAWFKGLDGAIQLTVAIIALVLAIYTFKIYKISGKKKPFYFGTGFIFVSLSYFVWAVLNMAIIINISRYLCRETHICIVDILTDISIYIHMALLMVGLLLISFSTFKKRNKETYILAFFIIALVLALSKQTLMFFYSFSSLLLLYLVIHYVRNYFKHKNTKTLVVGSAFLLLSIANLELVFGLTDGFDYTIGNILTLLAFLLIILNFVYILMKK
ncbi:hypothetical protein HYU09_00395 [Candidatus Woesearchaeota archaeon]|nr:hypothetical protein [Candidatus Woesearchaeota archaeon]